MGEVVKLALKPQHDPHNAGSALCIACKHEWVAVAPVGLVWLNCPSCGTTKGLFRHPVAAGVGDVEFRCTCGCEALTAYRHTGHFYLRCMSCGLDQTNAVFG